VDCTHCSRTSRSALHLRTSSIADMFACVFQFSQSAHFSSKELSSSAYIHFDKIETPQFDISSSKDQSPKKQ
jgi:hypothetical protein